MNVNLIEDSIALYAAPEFSRSGGPGGQNVNKVNTKVTLRLPVDCIAGLSHAELECLKERLGSRINAEGCLLVSADEERSQRANREIAFTRIKNLIVKGAALKKKRKPTKPGRAAREERLRVKKHRSEIKQSRRYSEF
jgi:ribosome-associated protein